MIPVMASPKPPSGCYNLEKFAAKTFTKNHFVPATGRGKFDCVYAPKQGILDVTVKIDVSSPTHWLVPEIAEKEQLRLAGIFHDSVPKYWDGSWSFKCTRKGWEGLMPVVPRFHLDVSPSHLSHFSLILSPPKEDPSMRSVNRPIYMRECRGFVSLQQVITENPNAKDRVELQDFHVEDFTHVLASQIIAQHERHRLQEALNAGGSTPFTLPVEVDREGQKTVIQAKMIALVTGSRDETSYLSMNTRILSAIAARAAMRLPGTPAVPIIVSPPGSPLVQKREDWKEHVAIVVEILQSFKLANPIKVGNPVPQAVTVTLRIDEELERSDLDDLRYNVAAHEFGHMIGLPDEYENPVASNTGKPEDNAKASVKARFLELVHKAKLTPPDFPSHTSSMMSDGMTVMGFHAVTVWNALCYMTRHFLDPADWIIATR
jgi:hypothetical protein